MDIYSFNNYFETTDESIYKKLHFSIQDLLDTHSFYLSNIKDKKDPFQRFLSEYTLEGSFTKLMRFCLNVELVKKYTNFGGTWLDIGSFGNDALRVKIVRPDIKGYYLSYEGCVIYLDNYGFHYGTDCNHDLYVKVLQLDIERENIPFESSSFDVVTAFEVIEHLKYGPQHFVREVNRILKTKGILIVTTSNANSAEAIVKILTGQHPAECPYYFKNMDFGRVHPLEYSFTQLNNLLQSYGFNNELAGSLTIGKFTDDEKLAISASYNFCQRLKLTTNILTFGQRLIFICNKNKDIIEYQYPSNVFV